MPAEDAGRKPRQRSWCNRLFRRIATAEGSGESGLRKGLELDISLSWKGDFALKLICPRLQTEHSSIFQFLDSEVAYGVSTCKNARLRVSSRRRLGTEYGLRRRRLDRSKSGDCHTIDRLKGGYNVSGRGDLAKVVISLECRSWVHLLRP